MRRVACVALLALTFAPAASAEGSIAVRASVTPRAHLFGDPVTAEVDVVVDARAAGSVRIAPDFSPYLATSRERSRRRVGASTELRFRYELDCLERACLPGQTLRRVVFAPVHVFARVGGREREVTSRFAPLTVRSRLSPEELTRFQLRSSIYPVGGVSYRLSPSLLFWAFTGTAVALVALTAALLLWVALGSRIQWRRDRFRRLGPVERAVLLVQLAARRDDTDWRRRALERLGRELEADGRADLGAEACRLAWDEAVPESESVLALAGRVEHALREGT